MFLLFIAVYSYQKFRPFPQYPSKPVLSEKEGYNRKEWPHWNDADQDCQNTRNEVLIAESLEPVTFKDPQKCKVKRGKWLCMYTGKIFTDPAQLDIDHMVPLKEAYRSGGSEWDRQLREKFANDLDYEDHLVAVDREENREKGDKDPSQWLPKDPRVLCRYLKAWVEIKSAYRLSVNPEERQIYETYREKCALNIP